MQVLAWEVGIHPINEESAKSNRAAVVESTASSVLATRLGRGKGVLVSRSIEEAPTPDRVAPSEWGNKAVFAA